MILSYLQPEHQKLATVSTSFHRAISAYRSSITYFRLRNSNPLKLRPGIDHLDVYVRRINPLRLFALYPTVVNLHISCKSLTNAQIRSLCDLFVSLETFVVNDASDDVTIDAFARISSLTHLRSFGISRCPRIADEEIPELLFPLDLETLSLKSFKNVDSNFLEAISHQKRLVTLNLSSCRVIDDERLCLLDSLRSLKELSMNYTRGTNKIHPQIGLESFKANGNEEIDVESLKTLTFGSSTTLRCLNLSQTNCSNENIRFALSRCTMLDKLFLARTRIQDDCLEEISRLTCLTVLGLSDTKVRSISKLSNNSELSELYLNRCCEVIHEEVMRLARDHERLQWIDFQSWTGSSISAEEIVPKRSNKASPCVVVFFIDF